MDQFSGIDSSTETLLFLAEASRRWMSGPQLDVALKPDLLGQLSQRTILLSQAPQRGNHLQYGQRSTSFRSMTPWTCVESLRARFLGSATCDAPSRWIE
jgi:hypothetical protein